MIPAVILRLLNSQIGRGLIVATVAALAIWWALDTAGDRREERVRAAIEKHNREKADAAAAGARNSDQCHDAGGRWLQSEGRCVLPRLPSP